MEVAVALQVVIAVVTVVVIMVVTEVTVVIAVVIMVAIQEDTEGVAIMVEVEVLAVGSHIAGTPTAGSIPITTTLRNVIPPIPLILTASTIKQSSPDP